MATLTRRSRGTDDGSDHDKDTNEDRPARRTRRSRGGEDANADDKGSRSSGRRTPRGSDDDDRGSSRRSGGQSSSRSRGRGSDDNDSGRSTGRRPKPASGFSSFHNKRQSSNANEFKPEAGAETLIKFLDAEPFDTFNQVWVEDAPKSEYNGRKSFVSGDYWDEPCPLLELGYKASTYSLINVLNLDKPDAPKVQVWKCSASVTDKLDRLANSKRTSPLDREDLYFAVTLNKSKNKTSWDIEPVKADDLAEDFDGWEDGPFTLEELEEYEGEKATDLSAIQHVDTIEELEELANLLD